MITLTESAKDYIYGIAVKNNKKIVTFGVLGGGCAGFSYKWDYAEEWCRDRNYKFIILTERQLHIK
mgnify:CR=1 FL=1